MVPRISDLLVDYHVLVMREVVSPESEGAADLEGGKTRWDGRMTAGKSGVEVIHWSVYSCSIVFVSAHSLLRQQQQ